MKILEVIKPFSLTTEVIIYTKQSTLFIGTIAKLVVHPKSKSILGSSLMSGVTVSDNQLKIKVYERSPV